MFGFFKKPAKSRRVRIAEHAAMVAFLPATMDADTGDPSVIAEEADRCVVQVTFGLTRPPKRKFYAIPDATRLAEELSFEDVRRFGVKRWR